MEIAIVLVLYNQANLLENLFSSLSKQTFSKFKIFIIDNASMDEPYKVVVEINTRLNLPLKFIHRKENLGYAEGNNIAVKLAYDEGFKYFLILNTDIELAKDCIDILYKNIEKENRMGCAGPAIYKRNNNNELQLQSFGLTINFKTQKKNKYFHKIHYSEKNGLPEKLKVDMIMGSVVLIKREAYEKCGLFEADFFMYNDEIDLAYRLAKNGYSTYVFSKAEAFHNTYSKQLKKKRFYFEHYYNTRNRYLYFHKYRFHFPFFIQVIKDVFYAPFIFKGLIKKMELTIFKYHFIAILHGVLNKKGRNDILFKKL